MAKKLIEVALPLEAINIASAREKSIRHGHPSTLHLWWARRPLAAARAVIFAQMVDDPSAHPDLFPTEKKQEKERQRLFKIIEDLVLWENTTNEEVLEKARAELWQSWRAACAENAGHPRAKELFDRHKLPAFHDPFAGGGALPLEAQRLGLEAYASDLNPVAVLINKAMIEIPPKFAGRPPINPEARKQSAQMQKAWPAAKGVAEDVRYYGKWMRDEAEKRIGWLYPPVFAVQEKGGWRHATDEERRQWEAEGNKAKAKPLTVIAWLWARTVKSPNPAFANVDVPLASTFMLSTKEGKEAYVEPIIEENGYRFTVKMGKPKDPEAVKNGTKLARGANFKCLMSGAPITGNYIKAEGKAGRMGARLMAIIAEGERGRIFFAPTPEHEAIAQEAKPEWKPDTAIAPDPRALWTPLYGLTTFGDLFTPRQLVALTTFSDLVSEAREVIRLAAISAGLSDERIGLTAGGSAATAYSEAIGVYLGFGVDYASNYWSVIATPAEGFIRGTFARQALPMTWDYAEAPPFGHTSGHWLGGIDWIAKAIELFPKAGFGLSIQADAAKQNCSEGKIVSTDPPYYDNIGYADLSDFFYVWMRRSQKPVFPDLFGTLAVPKAEELVAIPYRHGTKEMAEVFFLDGMTQAMHRLAEQAHPAFPVTIYYAFKQAESDGESGISSTGWDTFLEAVIRAGFAISGTWPMRTERGSRSIGIGTNALASSIILVCRRRPENAPTVTRREFFDALKGPSSDERQRLGAELEKKGLATETRVQISARLNDNLSTALALLQKNNIAPVDLAQAAIGPGMAIFTRYSKVLDAAGKLLSVRDALALINQTLDEVLAEQEGDFDSDSRWALAWFEQCGFAEGEYGMAETLSKAKNTSVLGMVEAGILASKSGKVRLLRPNELPADWDPEKDKRLTIWEMVHHLIRVLDAGGEDAAAELAARLGSKAEVARELAYRLYNLCERKKRAPEALSYNTLVQSWPEIIRLSHDVSRSDEGQGDQKTLFRDDK